MTLTTQTSAALIDGKAWAERVLVEVADSVAQLEAEGTTPGLAVVLIGEDAASQVYVRNKIRKAEAVGIRSLEYRFDTSLTQAELLALIDKLNQDPEVNGILVQLPLPDNISEDAVISSKNMPKGLSRKWSFVPGTRSEKCVLLRSVQPYSAASR